jgi:alpha-ketoglutarate-dependent taurine dioxygenase
LPNNLQPPFAPETTHSYLRWRERKLARYPRRVDDLIVEVRDPRCLSDSEADQIQRVCRAANMAIYASPLAGVADKDIPRRLGARLGLARLHANPLADEDGISSLMAAPGKSGRGYIPYSSQRLLWHTDGYYNAPQERIRAFILHSVQPAAEGGDNRLLDHEVAYILLRDADPDFVRALCAPNAMTIPAHIDDGSQIRAAQAGPVFSTDADTGTLHMRYTTRTRSIEWRQDEATRAAVQFLNHALDHSPYVLDVRLAGGQGIVCNNVLHNRSAFADDAALGASRLVYRARYFERIAGTATRADGERHQEKEAGMV